MDCIITDLLNKVGNLTDNQHCLIYKFLQTRNRLQNAIIKETGVYINLDACDQNTLYELTNYVRTISNDPTVYVKVPTYYVSITP